MGTSLTDSFAKYRWCPNIIGPQGGGSVHALPLHQYEKGGELQTKVPVEVSLDDRREFELAEQGFIVDARPGHVRVSPYFYNVPEDHRACLESLARG